jgi:23S rRNA pseudouridine2605 synthase
MPLLKALTETGADSRRKIADAIKHGRVTVNGDIVEGFGYTVNPETDRVTVNGKPVDLRPRHRVYLMLNKPPGVITTADDKQNRKTVIDILPQKYRQLRLYPVGRLDKDSTGLLLVTNDGGLTYRLTHPRFEHEKEYLIQIEGQLKPEEKRRLERGLQLEDGMTYPVAVREVKDIPPFNYSITMHEGRKRQVRRMIAKLGYRVLTLKRIRIGSLHLGNLKEGDVRELTDDERIALLEIDNVPPAGQSEEVK